MAIFEDDPEAFERPRRESPVRRAGATLGFLWDAARRRSRPVGELPGIVRNPMTAIRRSRAGRSVAWVLVGALTLGGIGLIAYPFVTDVWAGRIQHRLEQQFSDLTNDEQAMIQYRERRIQTGNALTRLRIPKLGVNVIVVEGTTGNALRAGAGHYRSTALPGEPGNTAIAGHRTGFGEPFRHLERMRAGDQIVMDTPIGRYVYVVTPGFAGHPNPWITHAADNGVLQPTAEPSLTLTTCDPPGTSKNRLIVRAVLRR